MASFINRQTLGRRFAFWLIFVGIVVPQTLAICAYAGRIFPNGPVTLYRENKAIGVYTQEAPLAEDVFFLSEQRCAVQLYDLYLVAEALTLFAVETSEGHRNLFVKEGIIFFKTADMRRPLNFITPAGKVSVEQIRLQAASGDSSIKGYVAVYPERTELGVAEGGSMDVSTDQGFMTISAGTRIILAQADMDIGLPEERPQAEPEPPPSEGWSQQQKIAAGAIGAGVVAGILLGLSGGGGGGAGADGGSVSPASP
jgi:hypothetical protein